MLAINTAKLKLLCVIDEGHANFSLTAPRVFDTFAASSYGPIRHALGVSTMQTARECMIDEETLRGSEWARNDADICREYDGQWVVARGREIVCAGVDMSSVGEKAAKLLKRPKESIVVVAIVSPDRLTASW